MSIIERVAEQLGRVERPDSKSSVAREVDSSPRPDPIERAVSENNRRSGTFEAGRLAAQPEAKGLTAESKPTGRPVRPTGRTSGTLRIDRERLRRQSMITPDGERTPITECFRRIKRHIVANLANPKADAPPANLVMVTSSLPGEGKTFCAINLAISLALEVDHTVLLVDADVARPSVLRALGLQAEKGLMDLLLNRRSDLAEMLWKTDIDKLTLMPSGTAHAHATEMLASGAMRALLREMAARYPDRIIVFDSPPLLATSEAGVLASQMGQIVMVVEAGGTTETALKDALGHLKSSNIAGLLLNKVENPGPGYYGGYGYGPK